MLQHLTPLLPKSASIRPYTAPSPSPAYLLSHADEMLSTKVVLPQIVALDPTSFDSVLVACFSAHPLVDALRHALPSHQHVTGLLHASVQQALQHRGQFGIVTTTKSWEPLLNEAVVELLASSSESDRQRFAGVVSVFEDDEVTKPVDHQTLLPRLVLAAKRLDSPIICLGGAKFAGWESQLAHALGPQVVVVDAFVASIGELIGA